MKSRFNLLSIALFLVISGFIVYFKALFYPFVHDDVIFIRENPNLGRWDDLSSVFFPFLTDSARPALVNPYYRPILDVFYKIEFFFFRLNPVGYHFINILIHVFNSILIYSLFSHWIRRDALAAAVAVLFLVHPVQSEAVACVSGISNLLFVFWGLMSFLSHALAKEKTSGLDRFWLRGISLLFFGVALLTKEQAIGILPLVIFMEFYWFRSPEINRQKRCGSIAGFVLVALVYFYWRKIALGQAMVPFWTYPDELRLRILAIPPTFLMYLGTMVFPHDLHYYRSVNVLEPFFLPMLALGVLVGAVITAARFLPKEERRIFILGLGIFLAALAPMLNILPLINEYALILTAEHFLYLPLAGFLLAIFILVKYFFKKIFSSQSRALLYGGFAGLSLICAVLTTQQLAYWQSEVALFERMIRYEKNFARGHALLGYAYYTGGEFEKAIVEYDRALVIFERYLNQVKLPAARDLYRFFIKGINFDKAHCYEALHRLPEAKRTYQQAEDIDHQGFAEKKSLHQP